MSDLYIQIYSYKQIELGLSAISTQFQKTALLSFAQFFEAFISCDFKRRS